MGVWVCPIKPIDWLGGRADVHNTRTTQTDSVRDRPILNPLLFRNVADAMRITGFECVAPCGWDMIDWVGFPCPMLDTIRLSTDPLPQQAAPPDAAPADAALRGLRADLRDPTYVRYTHRRTPIPPIHPPLPLIPKPLTQLHRADQRPRDPPAHRRRRNRRRRTPLVPPAALPLPLPPQLRG